MIIVIFIVLLMLLMGPYLDRDKKIWPEGRKICYIKSWSMGQDKFFRGAYHLMKELEDKVPRLWEKGLKQRKRYEEQDWDPKKGTCRGEGRSSRAWG